MDYDPDAPYEEGYMDAEADLGDDFDRIVTEEELFGDDLDEKDVFPDADDIGLAGSFAHMMQDERENADLPEDIDEKNFRIAMSMCTASGEARRDNNDERPFESYVRACINTPGFFKRRTS